MRVGRTCSGFVGVRHARTVDVLDVPVDADGSWRALVNFEISYALPESKDLRFELSRQVVVDDG